MSDIERFLDYDKLQLMQSGTGREEFLIRLAERYPVHELFSFYSDLDLASVNDVRQRMMAVMADDGIRRVLHRHRSDRKIAEIAGLIAESGVVEEVGPVHVYDVCSGSGLLAHFIANLRGGDKSTTAVCFDNNANYGVKFDKFHELLSVHRTSSARISKPGIESARAPSLKTRFLFA